jgi:hypothetical protein
MEQFPDQLRGSGRAQIFAFGLPAKNAHHVSESKGLRRDAEQAFVVMFKCSDDLPDEAAIGLSRLAVRRIALHGLVGVLVLRRALRLIVFDALLDLFEFLRLETFFGNVALEEFHGIGLLSRRHAVAAIYVQRLNVSASS